MAPKGQSDLRGLKGLSQVSVLSRARHVCAEYNTSTLVKAVIVPKAASL